MPQVTFILKTDSTIKDTIYVCGSCAELGFTEENALPMTLNEDGEWRVTVNINKSSIRYSYFTKSEDKTVGEPWMSRRIALPTTLYPKVAIMDTYMHFANERDIMRTKVFTEAVCYHPKNSQFEKRSSPVIFNVAMSNLLAEHELCLIGDRSALGKWDEDDAIVLQCMEPPYWCAQLDAGKLKKGAEYKYIIRDKNTHQILSWEDGQNRTFKIPKGSHNMIIVSEGEPRFLLPPFKGAGVAIPVFSLRTEQSCGCGEFNDLKWLANFAKEAGLKMIQTLPINDTTSRWSWKDSYPYSAISTFALHPIYINVESVGVLPDKSAYDKVKEELNSFETVDYETVMRVKMSILKEIFARDGKQTFATHQYQDFFNANEHWLKPYAAFSYFRDKKGTCETAQWGEASKYSEGLIEKVCNPEYEEYSKIAFYFFVQYHLDKQLRAAATYCHSLGIALKGDIPIGMDLNSVDVWQHPELFDAKGSAGAPPDDFTRFGQNWGFPIYNWNEMEKEDYAWWKARFRKMSDYFDAYRIDHILGFFRIFRIPKDYVWGLMGQFAPALPLSKDEILEYGVEFNEENMCHPDFSDETLRDMFGDEDLLVKEKYMTMMGNKRILRQEVNTQQKIQYLLPYSTDSEKKIKDGLMELMCNVLFVRDYQDPTKFHPRITLQTTLVYAHLSEDQKNKINKLYNYFYYQRHNEFWKGQAMKKLPALVHSTQMLCCGEDLGMVPECVPNVMKELDILSLEIQRMPKEMYVEFGNLDRVPYKSVSTTSTHDMSGIRAWWEEDRARTRRYFNNELHEYGEPPMFCEPWICERIITNHLQNNAMWVILPIQDWMSIDGNIRWNQTFKERVNDPADPDNYWHYRMHISIEDLLGRKDFTSKIKQLNKRTGRAF